MESAIDKWNPTWEEVYNTFYRYMYVTRKGCYGVGEVYERISSLLKESVGFKVKAVGVVVGYTRLFSKRNKPYWRVKIEYRDETVTHVVFDDLRIVKHNLYLFFGEIDDYSGYPQFKITKVEKLISSEEVKGRIKLK